MALLRDAKASGVLVEEVTWARLAQMTGGAVHQGIALQTAAADTLNLEDLVEGCAALQEAPLLLALDGLTDPTTSGRSFVPLKRWRPWRGVAAAAQAGLTGSWPRWLRAPWNIFLWLASSISTGRWRP